MKKYLQIWVSFATDCFGYSIDEATEMFKDNAGKFSEFLSASEIERMFEWSSLPVPANLQ